ncbi:Fic family protein [Sphingobium algorifonticola]|uniref:Fic family protein n=1 Tax=Sphingobium algorifonticola TaxID=2008318 RepID=A0A437J8D7_9SPHN|nr:Fic family protein [Sphingobium algorifonticola]RVT41769.1 Fic family protein [Sphingobium algorifonticola]
MTRHIDRAGRYVLQPQGYRAFIPAPLPPVPPIVTDDGLTTALSNADRALGRLDGSIETLPDPELFLSMFVRKEAVLSSQIEGTQASLSDVVKAEAAVLDRARPSDVREVQNYIVSMREGVALLDSLPISTRLISKLHGILMRDVRGQHQLPGDIRTSQNWIGAAGCGLGNALFVPPPHHALSSCLGNLENFIHDESRMPVLIKAGLIHGQFETIHPFLDGNGRLGRLLITLYLVEKKILSQPVLYLSYFFKENRQEYYQRLQAIRDAGDWEGWLLFFLNGVASVANLAAETAKRVLRLREEDRQLVINNFDRSASLPLRVLDRLYKLPVIQPNMVAREHATTYQTANAIIATLERIGLLTEVTGQKRNRVYVYERYMALFNDI